MCIVIDANVIGIFLADNHSVGSPVYQWLETNKNAKIVYGGTKYEQEIEEHNKKFRLGYLLRMRNRRKVVNSKELDRQIDDEQVRIENSRQKEEERNFDDPHLMAILNVTGCKLIFTADKRFTEFINKYSTQTGDKRPRVYRGWRDENDEFYPPNEELLSDKYIADCCKSHP